ncbi:acylphosphatase [Candidatus Micrarchaeota archaeon]|nr:acylphosphatase [Candidatus Micrarchaeota archaeon]
MLYCRMIASGRVQGVNFRAFVRSVATQMGVRGVVRNLEDGNVEVECECENKEKLEEFINGISKRDGFIKVDDVEILEEKETEKQFEEFTIDPGF